MKQFLFGAILTGMMTLSCGPSAVEKGNTCIRLGDYPMAMEFFGRALEQDPGSYEARLGMGKALLQKASAEHEDEMAWKQALMNLEAAGALAPEKNQISKLLSNVWFVRGKNLVAQADTTGALEALSRSIEHGQNNPNPVNLAAIIYFRAGYATKAEALFRKSVEMDSTHPSSHFNLGMVLWSREEYAAARMHWLSALKSAPEDEDILYWFALAEKKIQEQQ